MKVGIDIITEKVTLAVDTGGLVTTAKLTPAAAKLLAAQLVSSADNLLDYTEGKHGPYEDSGESR